MAETDMSVGQLIARVRNFCTKSTATLSAITGFAILVLVAIQTLAHFGWPVIWGRAIGYEPLAYTAIAWWAITRK